MVTRGTTPLSTPESGVSRSALRIKKPSHWSNVEKNRHFPPLVSSARTGLFPLEKSKGPSIDQWLRLSPAQGFQDANVPRAPPDLSPSESVKNFAHLPFWFNRPQRLERSERRLPPDSQTPTSGPIPSHAHFKGDTISKGPALYPIFLNGHRDSTRSAKSNKSLSARLSKTKVPLYPISFQRKRLPPNRAEAQPGCNARALPRR